MANFRSTGGHNMYSSIANLNTIPTEYELNMQPQQGDYDDLDLFMNTQLFDFDMGTITENNSPATTSYADSELLGMMGMQQNPSQQQQQQQVDFSGLASGFEGAPQSSFATLPSNAPRQNIQPAPLPLPLHMQSHLYTPSPVTSSPTPSTSLSHGPQSGDKRKSAAMSSPASPSSLEPLDPPTRPADGTPEDALRFAAEEDKRRRNTAASARFRVKKKQREAMIEKTAKEMTDKVKALEGRVRQLEMENRLLKELVTEKGKVGAKEEEVKDEGKR